MSLEDAASQLRGDGTNEDDTDGPTRSEILDQLEMDAAAVAASAHRVEAIKAAEDAIAVCTSSSLPSGQRIHLHQHVKKAVGVEPFGEENVDMVVVEIKDAWGKVVLANRNTWDREMVDVEELEQDQHTLVHDDGRPRFAY